MPSSALLGLLAAVGIVGLILRLFRSVGRLALRTAELAAASGMTESSARRGDVTRMQEGREIQRRARAARRRTAVAVAVWLSWLAVPPMVGYALEAYALAATLWLLPASRKPVVRGQVHDETE